MVNTQFLLLVLGVIAANILVWTAMFVSMGEGQESAARPVSVPNEVVGAIANSALGSSLSQSIQAKVPCAFVQGTPHEANQEPQTIYDFSLFGGDLESLNLRLRTLSPYVDTFFIAHPSESWRGDKVSTLFDQSDLATSRKVVQWEINQAKFMPKENRASIKYHDYEKISFDAAFLEFKQTYSQNVKNGSLLIVGRAEELPRPEVLDDFVKCTLPKTASMYALDMEAYMYGYQYPRYEAKKTPIFTKIVKWTPEEAKLLDGGYIRDGNRREKHIKHAGWYCESCYVNLTTAVARFPGWNDELVPSRYRYGIYLEMERYGPVYWQPNLPSDLPLQVTMNPERYSHMLSRRNSFSGFKDLRERLRLKRYKKYTCAELGGKERSPDDRVSPKVYDFFLYNGEQDLLEIRLNTLGPVVDKFLLAETNWTFTGKSKPFHFPTLKGKPGFTKYWDKVVHVQVDPPATDIGNWGREGHNRNRGLQQALALIDVQDEDFIQISDLDEIWRPTVATTMRKCTNFEKPHLTLRLTFQYFGFEFHHHAGAWANGKVLIWNTAKHTIDKVVAQSIRDDHGGGVQIHDAGWHCSWCFGNMSHVLSKVNSYSHQEHNQPEFLTRENILNGFKYGFDLFGRTWDQFEFHPDIQEIPDYVAHNRERFEYMLRRRNEWGGFYDVKAEIWKNITGADMILGDVANNTVELKDDNLSKTPGVSVEEGPEPSKTDAEEEVEEGPTKTEAEEEDANEDTV